MNAAQAVPADVVVASIRDRSKLKDREAVSALFQRSPLGLSQVCEERPVVHIVRELMRIRNVSPAMGSFYGWVLDEHYIQQHLVSFAPAGSQPPRWPQDGPRHPKMALRWPQDGPKKPLDGSQMAP